MFGIQILAMLTGALGVLISIAAGALVVVWMATKVPGPARQSGILGACLFVLGSLLPWVFSVVLSGVNGAQSVTAYTVVTSTINIIVSLLHAAGLVLVGRAVLLQRRTDTPAPTAPPMAEGGRR